MKKNAIFLMAIFLLVTTIFAAPVNRCRVAGELIADDTDDNIFYECDVLLQPVAMACAVGFFFDAAKKLCETLFPSNPSGEYRVCKEPKGMPYGCYAGNRVNFRPDCPDGRCKY